MTHRTRLALAAVVLIVFGVVALGVCVHHDVAEPDGPTALPTVLTRTDGDLRYTYHVATGVEGLFDVSKDPKMLTNLAGERPEVVRRLREEMQAKIGVKSLAEIRERQREMAERLRGLGYFK